MADNDTLIDALDHRRAARRRFLRGAGQAGLVAGGLAVLGACGSDNGSTTDTSMATPTPSPSATGVLQDQDLLNLLICVEYLEAQYFAYATTGAGISSTLLTGVGTQGMVTGGRQVAFSTSGVIGDYARELAADELAHVGFLRSMLGGAVAAMPAINIDGGTSGAFGKAMASAGVSASFDPYASEDNFLLSAFLLEDVVATAYAGVIPAIQTTTYLGVVGRIALTEAYHNGLIRSTIYARSTALRVNCDQISNYRDSLDGASDDDQGLTGSATVANVTPADSNGFAYARTPGQVLNEFYLTNAAVVGGGFFPNGVNGNINTSAQN